MDELIAFLRHQLDEDKRVINAACLHIDDCGGSGFSGRFDDDRLLAEVDAKRRILDQHYPIDPCDAHDAEMRTVPCDTVLALVQPHAGQPGWREEWRL